MYERDELTEIYRNPRDEHFYLDKDYLGMPVLPELRGGEIISAQTPDKARDIVRQKKEEELPGRTNSYWIAGQVLELHGFGSWNYFVAYTRIPEDENDLEIMVGAEETLIIGA